jgi:adenylosuccinate synthase
MPVTVVVGGQFGSEGKGKVAHFLVREMGASVAVRVGGPNSGHTAVDADGNTHILRQLPTAALLPGVICVVPAGSYLDIDVVLSEVDATGVSAKRLAIDPHAMLISPEDRENESKSGLRDRIGSTLSGTGAAIRRRLARDENVRFAAHEPRLQPYVRPVQPLLRDALNRRERVIIEGTQGFGLSLLHGCYPHVTSRDTTASAFIAEAGVSPLDVDDVVLTLRAFPIRVPGNSGELPHEIDWNRLTIESGSDQPIAERTSVTHGVRRVARFDPGVVRAALAANRPTRVVLNHLDHIDVASRFRQELTERSARFLEEVESSIQCGIDFLGFSPSILVTTRGTLNSHKRRIARI